VHEGESARHCAPGDSPSAASRRAIRLRPPLPLVARPGLCRLLKRCSSWRGSHCALSGLCG